MSLMAPLTGALKENTLGVVSLGSTLIKAVTVTTTLNKTFISAGRMNMVSSQNLGKTFSNAGMSMEASMQMYTAMFAAGVDSTNKTTKSMLVKFSLLGKNMKAATSLYAFNSQLNPQRYLLKVYWKLQLRTIWMLMF